MAHTFGVTITAQLRHQALFDLRNTFGSNVALARYLKVSHSTLGEWINLKKVPGARLQARIAPLLAKYGVLPEDIWPLELIESGMIGSARLRMEIRKQIPTSELVSLSQPDLLHLPSHATEDMVQAVERRDLIENLFRTISPRLERLMRHYYGIGVDRMTIKEIAEMEGVSRTYIAALITKAEKKMKRNVKIVCGGC